jgi:hypothetical protein
MASGRELIAPGERAPDFALPHGADRAVARFYGLVGGRPAILLFAGGDGDGVVSDVAVRLTAEGGDRLDVHVVSRSSPEAALEGTFHDPEGAVHDAYGAGQATPLAIVLDPNVRVAGTEVIRDAATAVDAIIDAVPASRAGSDILAPRLAPVLFVPDALAGEWCDELVQRWSVRGSVETGVETRSRDRRAEVTDLGRKRRRDHVVTDRELLRGLTRHVGARVFPELQKAFAFPAGGFEGFKIGCYAADDHGHFSAHRDNLSAATGHRRFGLSLNLNDDYAGGELRCPEYGATRYRPAAGEALVFSGSHLHEVLPVRRGRRFVLLSFVLARPRG